MKVLVVIPAYNEAENLPRVMAELKETVPEQDYVVVNDGSGDGTSKLCRERGYHLMDLPANLGLSGAFQAGIRYAIREGYEAVLQLDADGQHDPRYIEKMKQKMEESGADLVILSVNPHQIPSVTKVLAPVLQQQTVVLSIACGVYLCLNMNRHILGNSKKIPMVELLSDLLRVILMLVAPMVVAAAFIECYITPLILNLFL